MEELKLDVGPLPKPRPWQIRAHHLWVLNGFKGTIAGATGIGKSMLFYYAMQILKPKKVLIVVHTTELQSQHTNNIVNLFPSMLYEYIGLVGGGAKVNDFDKPITVAIVNSIRHDILKDKEYDLLILDEVHHYMSEINKTFLKAGKFAKILALSATPERDDGAHIEFFKDCPVVYTYGQKEAIEDKVLSPFKVINVMGHLSYMERQDYLKLQVAIEKSFEHYGHNFNYVMECANQQGHVDWRARRLRSAFTQRRIMLQNATDKILKTVEIVDKYEPTAKTIIFNEFINCAEAIYARLKKKGYKVDIEHSKLKSKERKLALEKFRNNETQILVTARTLDEGIDVPDCECVIITGGSSSKRQQIQRIGRGLRKQPDKVARVYQVYLNNTKDEDWVRGRMKDMRHIHVEWR